jgi:hypothetical protein
VLLSILTLLILPLLLPNNITVKIFVEKENSEDCLMQIQGSKAISRNFKETVENYLLHFPDLAAFPLSNGTI